MVAQQHVRMTLQGSFRNNSGTVQEIWTCSLSFAIGTAATSGASGVPTQAELNLVEGNSTLQQAIATWFSTPGMGASQNTSLDTAKFAVIGTDGKYIGNSAILNVNAIGGEAELPVMPSEVALAISFETGVRGSKGRGRIYFPASIMNMTEDWVITGTPGAGSMGAPTRTMINAVAEQLAALWNVTGGQAVVFIVASKVAGNLAVNQIKIGDVPDVVRRRRNKLKENYVPYGFPS